MISLLDWYCIYNVNIIMSYKSLQSDISIMVAWDIPFISPLWFTTNEKSIVEKKKEKSIFAQHTRIPICAPENGCIGPEMGWQSKHSGGGISSGRGNDGKEGRGQLTVSQHTLSNRGGKGQRQWVGVYLAT